MTIQIVSYRQVGKGSVIGSFDLFMPKNGIEIFNMTHFSKDGREWVSMPSRQYTDKQGATKYAPYIRFKERNHQDEFIRRCLLAIKEHGIAKDRQVSQEKQLNFVEEEFQDEAAPF